MGHKNMKTKKRKQAVNNEPSAEITKVKDEQISPNDVICLSDNSSSDDSSDDSTDSSDSSDSTDDDTDSSDAENLKVVVSDGKTQFSVKFSKKMSIKEFKRMYVVIRRIVRRNKISNTSNVINFHLKKGKKIIRKEKKKQHKNRKTDFTKTTNKCNLADKTEPKIEPKTECAEEIENLPNPSVWVNPPNSQPEKLNSAHSRQLSNVKDKIISSDSSNAVLLIGNVDANRIKIATNNPNSFRRYEDLNNADLDYIEETMDLNQLAEESASKNSEQSTEVLSNSSAQNTSQPPLKIIYNTSFEQEIKYEPELNISEDDEGFRATKNVSNVPPKQKVKDEPLEVDSKIVDSGIADQTSNNTALIDLEQVMIKDEPVEQEPVLSKDDVITLSDVDEDHKNLIIETSCKKKIGIEKTGENCKETRYDCNNLSKDPEHSDSSDDDLKYHKRLRNQLMKDISILSEKEETEGEYFEKDSPTLPKKRNLNETYLSSDYSDYAEKNSAAKKKRRTKIARVKSDDENETTDEEATFGDLRNQSNESNTDSRKVATKNNKYSNQKESHARPNSRDGIRPLNEKDFHDDEKAHCSKRSHDKTREFGAETSSVKKRRSDEKLADKKKASHEKMSGEKSEVEKSFEEEKSKEISDRLNKSEEKVQSHKNVINRRHSSESKSTRISENINASSNEKSSSTKTAVDPQPRPCGNPVVVLAKLDDQIKVSSPSESVTLARDRSNIKNITEFSTKQEAQTASTSSIDSLNNKRKVPTPEPKYSASKLTTKLNRDSKLKSKLETQNDLDMNKSFIKQGAQATYTRSVDSLDNKRKLFSPEPECSASKPINQQRHKSADSVSIDKMNTNKTEQYEGGTFNEAAMNILFEQSQQKVEEIKTFAINSGVTIVKLQMTMEARGHLVNEEPDKLAKQSVEFKRTSSIDKPFDKHESEFSEERERKDKSVKLAKEKAMNEKISLAHCDKSTNVKTEKRRSLDSDSKESFTEKAPSVNRNDFSKINAEMHKSLNVANEIFLKSDRTNAESVEKILPEETNFPYDVQRKSLTSFVGRIPKKTVCQRDVTPIRITSNCHEHNFAHSSNENSNTYEGKSPIENNDRSKYILSKAIQMVKETKSQNTQEVPPLMTELPSKRFRPTYDQFEKCILQLDPAFFKKTNGNVIQNPFGEDYIGIRQTYESYRKYYDDAESLLALKALDSMTDGRKKSHFKCSIVKGSIHEKENSKTEKMTTLKLVVHILDQPEKYPTDGDLISFTYFSWDEGRGFIENEVFASIKRVWSRFIYDSTSYNQNSRCHMQEPYELRTYRVMTKFINNQQIDVSQFGKMTMILESHKNMQNFSALKNLPYSPLLYNIIHPKFEDYQLPAVNSENYHLMTRDDLNAEQKDAVIRITETAIRRDPKICLIQGSPGTGKTTVVINLVSQLIYRSGKFDKKSPFRILVCTQSNSAADEIALRLLEERQKILKDERFRMVRVGSYHNISQRVKDISLEDLTSKEFDRFINAAMSYDHDKIRKSKQFHSTQENELRTQEKDAKWSGARNQITRKREDNKARWEFLKKRQLDMHDKDRKALNRAAESTVLEGAQVIVCTVKSSVKNCMESVFLAEGNAFSVCIIDDSTRISEVETLLPLSLGVKTLVLVGDTIQQPHSASIVPGRTKLHGLDKSLFARLWQAFDGHPENPIIQFHTQYRMAYPIMYWPHQYFYNGNLHSAANLRTLNLHCYKVINLPFTQKDGEVMVNDDEGKFVAKLVRILMNCAGLDSAEPVHIGVITPYHHQKALLNVEINRMLDRQPIELKRKIIVDVNTIDCIQGQERDVIIMSCASTTGTGLLSDKQKLCLALTRAKNCMILCGNFREYWRDNMWGRLLNDARTRKFLVNIKGYASDDYIATHIVREPQH